MTAPAGQNLYPISLTDVNTGETIVLQDPSGNALPIAIKSLQVAGADIRDATTDRYQADGTIDSTTYAGAAAVTMALTVLPDVSAHLVEDTLRGWLRPRRRAYLTVQRLGWPAARRLLVRADQLSPPVTTPGRMVAMQAAWRAIDGVWEGVDELTRTVYPGPQSSNGISFPMSLPFNFGAGAPSGTTLITSTGTEPTPPTIRIYGPVSAPGITNETTGQTIQFSSSYAVPVGEYVSINCANPNSPVLANDDPAVSRYSQINWSTSDLWLLQPGDNQIAFTGTGLSAVTQAVITWRERTA